MALYEGKESGRNRYVIAESDGFSLRLSAPTNETVANLLSLRLLADCAVGPLLWRRAATFPAGSAETLSRLKPARSSDSACLHRISVHGAEASIPDSACTRLQLSESPTANKGIRMQFKDYYQTLGWRVMPGG